jgi:hypothetical protein
VTGFDDAIAIADAVLYEGYVLYPYRASAGKNRLRFQFGVLVAPESAAATAEESWSRTECLCEPAAGATLRLRLRFLHLCARRVFDADGSPRERLTVAGVDHVSWDEAVERQVDARIPAAAGETVIPVRVAGWSLREDVVDGGGGVAGTIVRTCRDLTGEIRVTITEPPGPYGVIRIRVDVANTSCVPEPAEPGRDAALRYAFLGAHTMLAVSDGAFLSMADPPEWARGLAAGCANVRTWPALIGTGATVLSSPIILGDHPSIAPESPGDLCDGLEIDEILTLRTMTLTDDEKRQARATDPRARAIIDRSDAMPPEMLDRLHGTIRYLRQVTDSGGTSDRAGAPAGIDSASGAAPERVGDGGLPWWDPAADASVDPDTDRVLIDGVSVGKGSRVRLAPRRSGTDAQDMFLAGRDATVQAVLSDVDGSWHVAVTVDDDPAAGLQYVQGRFRYFRPTELKPVRP